MIKKNIIIYIITIIVLITGIIGIKTLFKINDSNTTKELNNNQKITTFKENYYLQAIATYHITGIENNDVPKSLEDIVYIPQDFSTIFDGEEKTSSLLRQHFHFNNWQKVSSQQSNVTVKVPPKIQAYSGLIDTGCEKHLIIKNESKNTFSTSFFIFPNTPCTNPIINNNETNKDPKESVQVFVLKNIKNTNEIKSFIINQFPQQLTNNEICNFNQIKLFNTYSLNGFQYLFPLSPLDDRPISSAENCNWTANRPRIKYNVSQHTAIIMIDNTSFYHPDFILHFSDKRQGNIPFNRIIFESITID